MKYEGKVNQIPLYSSPMVEDGMMYLINPKHMTDMLGRPQFSHADRRYYALKIQWRWFRLPKLMLVRLKSGDSYKPEEIEIKLGGTISCIDPHYEGKAK